MCRGTGCGGLRDSRERHMRKTVTALCAASSIAAICATAAAAQTPSWCSGNDIVVFSGGPSGGTFNSIIDKGALQAAADTGANVQIIYSDWNFEQMVTQFRDMIGQTPDGIAMMGHPGDAALMPLAEQAEAAGIKVMYMNVDVPEVRAKFGSGFVGASLYAQGRALAAESIRLAGDRLAPGDTAIVMSRWEAGNRAQRELGLADALEEWGMTVIKLQEADGASRRYGCLAGPPLWTHQEFNPRLGKKTQCQRKGIRVRHPGIEENCPGFRTLTGGCRSDLPVAILEKPRIDQDSQSVVWHPAFSSLDL